MQVSAIAKLERWAADWAHRRQGSDAREVVLRRRRIYILPTRFGVLFGAMVFSMLLGSLNYGASLAFLLTFMLAGLGLVIMHHCHNNLLGLRLRFVGARPVFAGQLAEFRIALDNEAAAPRYEIELKLGGHHAGPIDVAALSAEALNIGTATERRGWIELPRFAIQTRHPGRLFRAWTWIHMNGRCLVYPAPAPPGRPLPVAAGGSLHGKPDQGDADFAGLRAAVPGDPPQRIAWKAYARSDTLLLKQFSSGEQAPCVLDWNELPDLEPEARLAQLTRWCLDAAAQASSFELRLPGVTVPLGADPEHLARCLQALALFEAPP
jgi:uncharacterized protein (DUF58 family)